ncbi:MAG: hypothetical protein KAI81_09920 [Candidatus Marinimicrobia bacterium]|nr:hypothetical protein [Candidatus Neomarinimicrobiota bacterium]
MTTSWKLWIGVVAVEMVYGGLRKIGQNGKKHYTGYKATIKRNEMSFV